MLKFLLEKLRQAPGPMKQARLIAADLAEEMIDLAQHYKQQFLGTDSDVENTATHAGPDPWQTKAAVDPTPQVPAEKPSGPSAHRDFEPSTDLDITPELAKAMNSPSNRKKQEFKVLAILWDASEHKLGALSAKEISAHGEKLGLSIRHENVRKVIRMRLKKYVIIRREPKGNSTIFHYRLSSGGNEFFAAKYLNH
jgi:hypothetical protein